MIDKKESDFLIFLFCGQLPYMWFSKSISNSMSSLINGRGLMNQVSINKFFFPLVIVVQDSFKSLVVFIVLVIYIFFESGGASLYWLFLPLIILTQLILIMALSFVVAMLIPFVPDIRFIVSSGLTILMFASGIFFDYKDVISSEHKALFFLNPIANLINSYRNVLIYNQYPDFNSLLLIIFISFIIMIFCIHFMKKLGAYYPRLVIE